MLLLGSGHCFRDHVLGVCPELSRFSQAADGIQKTFEGSSLETIRHMVASGVGITVLPRTSVPDMKPKSDMLAYVPFADPVPDRRVVLAWRRASRACPRCGAVRRGSCLRAARRAQAGLKRTGRGRLSPVPARRHPAGAAGTRACPGISSDSRRHPAGLIPAASLLSRLSRV